MISKFIKTKNFFYNVLLLCLAISLISALVAFNQESKVNDSLDEASEMFYWWFANLTTIGYNNSLETDIGRMAGMISMVTGSFMYLGLFSELIIRLKNINEEKFVGIQEYFGLNHVVIIGYNNLAVSLITLLVSVLKDDIDIVLVTNQIDSNPNPNRIKFIRENPVNQESLTKAQIDTASLAIVLSRDDVSDQKSDFNVMLIGGMIEESQKKVHTLVEISSKGIEESMRKFHIDDVFTFFDLLEDTRNKPTKSKILKKIPKDLRESILKEDFV